MTAIILSTEARDFTVETLKAEAGVAKRWIKSRDMLRAEGVTSVMLEKDKDVRDYMKKDVILLSFTKAEQAIFAKPSTTLSDEEKVTKRWVVQQIGSRLAKIQSHVKKAEEEEVMSDDERGARRVAALESRLRVNLSAWVERIEKAEAVTFPAVKMLEILKAGIALLPNK
jgi:hypothetical protein